ncbi:MAG TPA: MFS transporter, partial [Bacillales bacterium]|nr:MFS transporter [Bacillales bacterium]
IAVILGSVVSGLFSGYLSDKYGRKNILIFSFLLQFLTVAAIAIGIFPGHEMPILAFLGLLFFDISAGLQVPPMEAMIIDVTTPETRRSLYGLIYWLSNFAVVFGTLLGAFLHTRHFFILTVVTAAVILILYLLVQFFIKETTTLSEKKEQLNSPMKEAIDSYKFVFKDRTFLKFAVGMLMIMGLEMQLPKYISVRLTEQFHALSLFGIHVNGVEMFGILKIENSIVIVLFTMIIAKLLTKYKISDHKRMNFGIALFALGFVVLGFSNDFWILLGFMAILSIGEVIYVPIEKTLLAEIADETNRSKYIAATGLSMRLGSVLSALWLSLSAYLNSWGMSFTYTLMGLVAILMFFLIYQGRIHSEEKKEEVV